MVAMTDTRTLLPDDRPLTIDDLDLLPDDGNKYELDDGVLIVSPAPANMHQLVLHRLSVRLAAACPEAFLILPGPGLEVSRTQYRVPDLAVVRADDFDAGGKSVTRAPVLAVEIASPSTAMYDRNRKKDVYAGFGIDSYWIVKPDLENPSVTAFELHREDYRIVAEVSGDKTFRPERPFPCEIGPSELIAGPWLR